MFDLNEVEKAAQDEIRKEQSEKAKGKIKEHLRKIAQARQVVTNLEAEYEVLKREIGADVG